MNQSDPKPLRRLGVIGDVHAEHDLLAQALEWLHGQRIDAVLCTGDLADGGGCVERSVALLEQAEAHTVAGNHDRWLLQDRVRHVQQAHSRAALSDATLAYLAALPRHLTLRTAAGALMLCHGVAEDDLGRVWPGNHRTQPRRSERLDDLIAAGSHRLVINGHMHFRVLLDFPGLTLCNAGTLKGPHAGVSILDTVEGSIATYEFVAAGMERVAEAAMDATDRPVWENTGGFDGSRTPTLLYRDPLVA